MYIDHAGTPVAAILPDRAQLRTYKLVSLPFVEMDLTTNIKLNYVYMYSRGLDSRVCMYHVIVRVCVSVCYHSSEGIARFYAKKEIRTALV